MSEIKDKAIAAIQDKKGKNILALDLRRIDGAVCDWFVICNADSTTQVAAIVDGVEEKIEAELKEKVIRTDGMENCIWVAMDYGDVMVHVFQTEARDYYKLEDLWTDADITRFDTAE